MRKFKSGATRDTDKGKIDYEGFLSPIVIQRFGEYMHKNRLLPDGSVRDSDNWQKGIPKKEYIKSLYRHFMNFWLLHRGHEAREDIETALCGIIFNSQGYLYETIKKKTALRGVFKNNGLFKTNKRVE